MVDISERSFEQTIEAALLAGGPDAYPGGEGVVVEPLEADENAPVAIGRGCRKTTTRRFALIPRWSSILSTPRSRRFGDSGDIILILLVIDRLASKAAQTPATFPSPTCSRKKSSKISTPPSNESAKSPWIWAVGKSRRMKSDDGFCLHAEDKYQDDRRVIRLIRITARTKMAVK
jgi:hypothetical protein